MGMNNNNRIEFKACGNFNSARAVRTVDKIFHLHYTSLGLVFENLYFVNLTANCAVFFNFITFFIFNQINRDAAGSAI